MHVTKSHRHNQRGYTFIEIIATMVIVVDQYLRAFMPDVSKKLSVFVGLIITNCIVMGRAEAFAMKNNPTMSLLDGIGNGIGYSVILRWVNYADLFRVKGIGGEFAELLEAAGVDTVPDLSRRNSENLQKKMTEVNEAKKLVRRAPSVK